ncbi:glycosyltransferase [Microbacter sp. GSS18]|nr:glycosyltransferase [Microbacter sp. GSS18]
MASEIVPAAGEMPADPAGPRVCIVGPVRPYRGGIAQHTESLATAMRDFASVRVFSFAKQYPQSLYPGETDIDPDLDPLPDVDYSLSATRPLSWRKTVDRMIALAPDVVVFAWWTLFWQPWTAYMARRLRRAGVRTVFLCHNLGDHGAGRVRRRLSRLMLSSADGYIVHAEALRSELTRIVPDRPVMARAHPVYDRFPAPARMREPRGRLEILFFGFIRPYKGLEVLLEAMALLDDDEVHLTIVGECWDQPDRWREGAAALRAETVLRYVSDAEAAEYFARADLVVLPYRSATGSGVVSAAFHYGTPVLATRVGGLVDVIDESTGILVPPGDARALADALRTATRESCAELGRGVRAFAGRNTWGAFAGAVVSEFADRRPRGDRVA